VAAGGNPADYSRTDGGSGVRFSVFPQAKTLRLKAMRIRIFIHARDWRQRALLLVLVWAVLTGILIAVGLGVVHASSVNALDRHVTSVVVAHRTTALNEVMKAVTWLGSWVALVATGILLTVLVLRRRLPMVVLVLAVVAWAGVNGGTTLAKHVVGRDRPPQDLGIVSAHGWSWPSGHTAVALLVFTTLALVVVSTTTRSGYRTLAWILAAMAVAAVGYSRIELGVHWMTDVIASMIFASALLMVLYALFASDIRPNRTDVSGATRRVVVHPRPSRNLSNPGSADPDTNRHLASSALTHPMPLPTR
jgi:membrane-associated phospholipid phosphatase